MSIDVELDEPQLLAVAGRLAVAWLADDSQPGLTVFLRGDLGAGKTTFARGFLRACGHTGVVKSPTYTLVEPYSLNARAVYHFDLYRLSDPEELEFTGARDYFQSGNACLVEWPEKAAKLLPTADIECQLSVAGEGRRLRLGSQSRLGEQLMLAMEAD